MNIRRFAFAVLVLGALVPGSTRVFAQSTTSRIALVIGEAQYRDGPLATAANDGGLMADLLRQAGYDVTGAANLSQEQIRAAFREFLEKAAAAGPGAEVFVYLSGKGIQFAGENYLAPVEASVSNSASVPAETVRLSDFLGPLEGLPARARIVVLDLAKTNAFGRSGPPLASGLAIADVPDRTLLAFNAAPGTIAPDEPGPYGAYAQSLVAMLRQPGLPLNDAFAQVRLRVNEATRGGQTPWNVTKLDASMAMFAPAPGAPRIVPPPAFSSRRPLREVPPPEAYGYAVERDTFESYSEFLVAYPNDPLARRVRAMLAARREAITWRRTYLANTPEAYWTYLQRYPHGPHAADSDRRLAFLSASLQPPPRFREYEAYDIPPPPDDEVVIIDRPRFYVNEVVDVPPPRYSDDFLPPIPREYRDLPPPPPPPRAGYLPIPIPIPIPFGQPQRPAGIVIAPRFVQQPAPGQPGTPPAPPQGYSPQPPAGAPGGPRNGPPLGGPGVGSPPAGAPPGPGAAPGRMPGPAGAPGPAPVGGPTPSSAAPPAPGARPPTQTLPSPAAPLSGSPPAGSAGRPVAPPVSAPGVPNVASPRPTQDERLAPAVRPPAPPAAAPSQTLPSPAAPHAPAAGPAGHPTPEALPAPPRPAAPPVQQKPAGPPERPVGTPDLPKAPPAAARPDARPELPATAPRAEPPHAAPRAEPPAAPHVEAPKPAAPPAPHIEAPRAPAAPPAPHIEAPKPAAAPHPPGAPGAPHEGGGRPGHEGGGERRPE